MDSRKNTPDFKDRTQRLILSGSVNLCTSSWTSQMSPSCVAAWTLQTLHPTLHMSRRGDRSHDECRTTCLWLAALYFFFLQVHAEVLHMPTRIPISNWTSCTVIFLTAPLLFVYPRFPLLRTKHALRPTRLLQITKGVYYLTYWTNNNLTFLHPTSVTSTIWTHL